MQKTKVRDHYFKTTRKLEFQECRSIYFLISKKTEKIQFGATIRTA